MTQKKITFSLSEKTVSELEHVAKTKQLPKSVILALAIEKYYTVEKRKFERTQTEQVNKRVEKLLKERKNYFEQIAWINKIFDHDPKLKEKFLTAKAEIQKKS